MSFPYSHAHIYITDNSTKAPTCALETCWFQSEEFDLSAGWMSLSRAAQPLSAV